jgi:hypothetical protein
LFICGHLWFLVDADEPVRRPSRRSIRWSISSFPGSFLTDERIAAAFPGEVRPYVVMIEIALGDLTDGARQGSVDADFADAGLCQCRDDRGEAQPCPQREAT